jgi:hypothetical protein
LGSTYHIGDYITVKRPLASILGRIAESYIN